MEFQSLFGFKVEGIVTPIGHITSQQDSMYDVIIEGEISQIEVRGPFKNNNRLYSGVIYDGNQSMYFKFFHENVFKLKSGKHMKMKGKVEYDKYKKELVFEGLQVMEEVDEMDENGNPIQKAEFVDTEEEKRIEFNFLSKMSRHQSTLSIADAVNIAKKMGHRALAVTDKEVVQGFPEAFNIAKKEDFKIIYGVTMNMVDDSQPIVFGETDERIDEVSYTVWDFETTGLSNEDDDIIEVGATKFEPWKGYVCSCGYEITENEKQLETDTNKLLMEKKVCPSCFGKKKQGVVLTEEELTAILEVDEEDTKTVERTLQKLTHKEVGKFREIVYTDKEITPFITELTGITQEEVQEGKPFREVIESFHAFWEGTVLVAHNAPFDKDWLETCYNRLGVTVPNMTVLDTLQLSRVHRTDLKKHNLGALSKAYGVELLNHHRADEDAQATGEILVQILVELLGKDIKTFKEINNMRGEEYFKTIFPTKEVTVWVKTQAGLKNLYKLISESHTTYLTRTPTIPKRIIEENREGLIIGSGGMNGHLFELALNKMPTQVREAVAWYDVIEIQPNELASHYPRQNKCQGMHSIERSWKNIYDIAREQGKMIIATGSVQYAKKEHRIPQHMLLYSALAGRSHKSSQGRLDDLQGYTHFRSTNEMLEELSWLPSEDVHEIVVKNPNALADSIETLEIIPKELFTPKIEGANEQLEEMTMKRAKEIYGSPIPPYVQARLEKELKSILGYGFSVIYLISQELVKQSVADGYLVGSRGSVGSSFVATMSGITEVNPLKPHYHCTNCQWSTFFDHEEIQSGYDLPRNFKVLFNQELYSENARQHFGEVLKESLGEEVAKQVILHHEDDVCPKCQEAALKRDGQDIPFETFLGFKGDKVPDIDLNFSGEYQGKTHRQVEEKFGSDYVFRAGTVGTVADKTAFGYVRGYYEKHINYYQEQIELLQEELKELTNPTDKVTLEKEIKKHSDTILELREKLADVLDNQVESTEEDNDEESEEHVPSEVESLEKEIETHEEKIQSIKELMQDENAEVRKEKIEQKIKGYQEKIKELTCSNAEIARLASIIEGSRRTSGQHPGGMLVVPDYKDIHDFTPYQYPANSKVDKKGVPQQRTSHFDFHAIHDNILKLDILGHDDPTELNILERLTGINPKSIPANDEKALKLFTKAEEVGIPLSEIEAKTGTLGIPEFGTEFVQEMILDTMPTTFAELVKISGLSHGTDVWLNNAKDLVKSGICTLKNVIDTRDNIMVALQQKGLEDSVAFNIMESVRKGKGLTPEMEESMRIKSVEQWYMDSCKKIKYMFPKAHAAAYVLSAMRIAYFKVHHPIQFYAAHLSVRSCTEDIVEIMKDKEMLRPKIRELAEIIKTKKATGKTFSKEKDLKDALDLVLEAKARGIEFAPPRIYGSHATEYLIDGNTLVAPFSSIPGIGEIAAETLYEEAQKGIFRGVDDLKTRGKVSATVIDSLRQMGCLELVEEIQFTLY